MFLLSLFSQFCGLFSNYLLYNFLLTQFSTASVGKLLFFVFSCLLFFVIGSFLSLHLTCLKHNLVSYNYVFILTRLLNIHCTDVKIVGHLYGLSIEYHEILIFTIGFIILEISDIQPQNPNSVTN